LYPIRHLFSYQKDGSTVWSQEGSVDEYASEWLFTAHFDAESQTCHAASPAQSGQLPVGSSGLHPAEFAAAFGHSAGAANVTSLLRHHLRAGNIKRVSRAVFAAVPAHLAAERMVIDRFAAASKLRSDGVVGFHSALELHGIAYSEFNEVQLVSAGRTERVDLPFGACRFVTPPKALAATGQADYLTTTMDRQRVPVRVTAVERTVVDVLHRPELAGGAEEVLKSLDLVRYLDPTKVADYVELLDNRSLASVSGWWLERRLAALGVTDDVLARLRARLPQSKHYALGAEPGHAVLVEPWRVLLPAQAVDAAFEGV
jgi:predicted transcriptional regulator of viral defense system